MAPAPAKADTFVWKDAEHGYTVSFPDMWRVQTEDGPTTRLRIAGPIAEDMATCRVQVDEDGRLKIYPKRLMDEAVMNTLDRSYWDQETAQYQEAEITGYYTPASISGKGDATAVTVSFVGDDGEGPVSMQGAMIGGIYGGKRYVVSCSAKAEVYAKWSDVFASIMDSVELHDRYHPFATGYYRAFLNDPKLALPRIKPGTIHTKNIIHGVYYNE